MTDDLASVWSATQARLREGWQLDGLRCASTGLGVESRSDDWIAVAVGPDGEERTGRAATPGAALEELADGFDST